MPACRKLSPRAHLTPSWKLRRVDAPEFIGREFGWSPPNHIFSTVCRHDEEIDWTWTHTSQGSYVSGFVKRSLPSSDH